jgi:hypothetical protein
VHFVNHELAKLALAGNFFPHIMYPLGLNKFKLDKDGRELRATFYAEH